MYQVLEDYCLSDDPNGLLLLSMPTGAGKTYNVLKFIKEHYSEFAVQKRKILFVTNLKKNLPVEDLRRRFEEANELNLFKQHVLFVDSNASSVIDHLSDVDHEIPDEFKTGAYNQLRENIEILRDKGLRRSLRGVIEQEIRSSLEPAFRNSITEHLRTTFRKKEDRLQAIRTDKRYQWIGRLYPSVFTDERTVLFMSIDKFLVKNSTLVEPSYNIADRLAPHSVIFIDEFDATKENVLRNIIQSGIRHRTNVLDLFLNIHGHLMQSECPASLMQESEHRSRRREEKGWPLLSDVMVSMRGKADEIFTKYALQHTCKSHADFFKNKRNFLFYDYEFHNVLDARNKRIEIRADENSRTNWITALDGSESEESSGNNIRSLLREISGFLSYFQRGIGYFAENYQHLKLEDEAVLDVFPLESAVRTTLNHFRLDSTDVEFLVTNIMESQSTFVARQGRNSLERGGFYESGFRFHDIVDSDDHDTLSKVYMYDFSRTPELFLCDVCASALVIGISATAGLQSNIGNYDLEYLKSVLGSAFINLPETTLERLRNDFYRASQGYDQIEIKTAFVDGDDIEESKRSLAEMLNDEETADALLNQLRMDLPDEEEGSHESIYNRYVRALTAWKYFFDHPDCRAFLCLFSKQLKQGDKKFDRELFIKMARIISDNDTEMAEAIEDTIVDLGGDGYEAKKDRLLESLGKVERRFVLSTYQTIGAGQNLQYPVPEGYDPIHINEYPARGEIDFDGIYLDRPTNLLVNIFGSAIAEEDFIKYLFQLEFLVENGTISAKTFNAKLDAAFHSYVGRRKPKWQPGDGVSLYESQAYCRFVNKNIMQAIGRICRSNMKASVVHILVDSVVKKHLARFSIPPDVIPVREYMALVDFAGNEATAGEDFEDFENRASSRSDRAMAYIRRLLRNQWTEGNVSEWEALRTQVLKKPVLNRFEDEDSSWQGAYIQLPVPASRYRYSQEGDYKRVEVSFSHDSDGAEVSASAARLPELMKVPSLRELFAREGWATDFNPSTYMISPPMFNNIYKGALGEVCGRQILEEQLGVKLLDMDVSEYELFDCRTGAGIYVDFKLWNDQVAIRADDAVMHIRSKMQAIERVEAVFIINILGSGTEEFMPTVSSDELIYEIPFICQNGTVSEQAMKYLLKEFSKCRQ